MELLYLWVDEYFVLRDCSFNFSNRYIFDIKFQDEEGVCQLHVKNNKTHVPNLFPGNILNVTAIVGVNGVGKSTLIDFILRTIHNEETIGSDWVAVFRSKDEFVVNYQLIDRNKLGNWKIRIVSENQDIIAARIQNKYYTGLKYRSKNYQHPVVSIFYNPSLDLKDYKGSLNSVELGIVDVSTNYLIWEDYENRTNDEYDSIENHRFKNTYRQFGLSQSKLVEFRDLKIPDQLEVRFNKNRNVDESDLGPKALAIYKFLEDTCRDEAHNANGRIEDARDSKQQDLHFREILGKVKVWFVWNVIYDFFSTLSRAKQLRDETLGVSTEEVKGGDTYLDNVFTFFEKQKFASAKDYSFKDFIQTILNIIDSDALRYRDMEDNESFFRIPVGKAIEVHQAHFKYRSLYAKSKAQSQGFLDFNWRDLSNGEKAYLDLYSRIFEGYRRLGEVIDLDSTLYVVIDEGEIGFHPQWQKEYLNNVIHFLNRLSDLKVQLIITSHSPFVLSDLPKSNVILLNKDKDNKTITDSLSVKEETFAANIHELFADSFFMRNGTIGDFAKRKIEEVINLINRKENILDREIEHIKKVIALIGEPIIKDRLIDMFNERFGKVETLQDRITRLQAELGEAQDQLKKNASDQN
jgi:hypothetical protein